MAVSKNPAVEALLEQEKRTVEHLQTDTKKRRVTANGNGSLRTTLPPTQAVHLGITEGTGVRISMHDGHGLALIDEPALIIQPDPAWED